MYPVYHDSSPAELGAQVASEVPDVQSGKETFTVWVKKRRKDLQNLLDTWQNGDLQGMPVNLKIQREIPTNDLFIEWIYTIDFDNLVFCVDSKPLYDLANMPTGEDFVNYIGKLIFQSSQEYLHYSPTQGSDNYGVRSFTVDTPEQYRYKWRPQPIILDDELLKLYDSCVTSDSPTVPLHNLLGISEDLTALEKVRVSLIEVIIGAIRKSSEIVDLIYEIESRQPNDWRENFCASIVALTGQCVLPTKVLGCLLSIHSLFNDVEHLCILQPFEEAPDKTGDPFEAARPQFVQIPRAMKLDWSSELRSRLTWLRDRICLLAVSPLEDERSLAVSIGEIVRAIKDDSSRSGTVFGVVFSLTHCSVVRLELGVERGTTLRHTAVLSFLPSSRAIDRSTPGITALARLMIHLTEDPLQDTIRVLKPVNKAGYFDDPLFHGSVHSTLPSMPVEVCEDITKYLDTIDNVNFAHLSPTCRQAASYTLRYPHIQIKNDYYILLQEVPQIACNLSDDSAELHWRVLQKRLTCSAFHATNPTHGRCLVTLGIVHVHEPVRLLSSGPAYLSFLDREFVLECSVYEDNEEAIERFREIMSSV